MPAPPCRHNNPFVPGVSGGIRKAKAPLSELVGDGERGGKRGGSKGAKSGGKGGGGRCASLARADAWWLLRDAFVGVRLWAGGGGPSPSVMSLRSVVARVAEAAKGDRSRSRRRSSTRSSRRWRCESEDDSCVSRMHSKHKLLPV